MKIIELRIEMFAQSYKEVKAIWNHDNYSENVQHGILTARGIQNNFF